ncbi:hypothetical protein BDR03DRAFT_949173 [Suillus americanus]|nr:hypothetical protein BDR03DRAFT_949173 [Suillus americanus]
MHNRHVQLPPDQIPCPSTPARQPHFYIDPASGLRRSPRKTRPDGYEIIPLQIQTTPSHQPHWDIPAAESTALTPVKIPARRGRTRVTPKPRASKSAISVYSLLRGLQEQGQEVRRRHLLLWRVVQWRGPQAV